MHTEPKFIDEEAARKHIESIRWPNGPVCPHCGGTERNSQLQGESHRAGLYFCGDCRSQFTVTIGTVFERSKIPLHKWVYATHLMCSSKKGISSKQLERMLGVTYKTAWFMSHRIREAMKPESGGLLGSGGQPVEADETYIGKKIGAKVRRGPAHKEAIFSLVERNGSVRSFHVPDVKAETLKEKLLANVSTKANLMTDKGGMYRRTKESFPKHAQVDHGAGEYVRGTVHTNTVEGFFGIFKRGMYGTYQHVSSHHLERYTTEFDFRYNNRIALGVDDNQRTDAALKGISGKRLTYRRIGGQA
ncbi:MAG TPA: IS1595 family transposase [Burkholderiales bacterium]|nr:IS1595 family transposase [Burkholderiales bacterium]